MKIKDRPEFDRKAALLTFPPDEFVITAVRAMSEKNYGAAVIVSPEQKPVGIVTERDFMRRLLNKVLDPNTRDWVILRRPTLKSRAPMMTCSTGCVKCLMIGSGTCR